MVEVIHSLFVDEVGEEIRKSGGKTKEGDRSTKLKEKKHEKRKSKSANLAKK